MAAAGALRKGGANHQVLVSPLARAGGYISLSLNTTTGGLSAGTRNSVDDAEEDR